MHFPLATLIKLYKLLKNSRWRFVFPPPNRQPDPPVNTQATSQKEACVLASNHMLPKSTKYWWRWQDSNPLPIACKATALPGELHPQIYPAFAKVNGGLIRTLYCTATWWVWLVSNQRPLRYQHSALTNWATDPSRSPGWLGSVAQLVRALCW